MTRTMQDTNASVLQNFQVLFNCLKIWRVLDF